MPTPIQVVTTKCSVCMEGFLLKNNTCVFQQYCREGKFYSGSVCDYCYKYSDDCYTCGRSQ